MAQTHRQTEPQTDGHGDSMTNSAQWGRVGENKNKNICGTRRKGEYVHEYIRYDKIKG